MTDAVRRTYGLRHQRRSRSIGGVLLAAITAVLLSLVAATASFAEEPIPDGPPSGPWGPGLEKRKNTTTVERGKTKGPGLRLVALLTGDGQQIDQGLVWRVFQTGGRQANRSFSLSLTRRARSLNSSPASTRSMPLSGGLT